MGDGRIATSVSSESHKGPQLLISWQSCEETSRPFRKHCYRKWLYQPWFIAAHFIPEAQNPWALQESQIYLDTIALEKHCNCPIIVCYRMETQGQQWKLLSSILEKASGQPAALNKINKRLWDYQPINMP